MVVYSYTITGGSRAALIITEHSYVLRTHNKDAREIEDHMKRPDWDWCSTKPVGDRGMQHRKVARTARHTRTSGAGETSSTKPGPKVSWRKDDEGMR
jgi:hypothetical protein